MAKIEYTPEMIVRKLREAEILQGQGNTIAPAARMAGAHGREDGLHHTRQPLGEWLRNRAMETGQMAA